MPATRSRPRRGALAAALVACSMTAPAGGCGAREEPVPAREEPVAAPALETRIAVRHSSGREARAFRTGEAIVFAVTLRNRADSPRTLSLPTSQTHDVLVEDKNGREIWRYSAGRMFAQVITALTLEVGESRAFTVTWTGVDSSGRAVPPGDYRAVGLVPAGLPGCRSDAVPFSIGPSGAAAE